MTQPASSPKRKSKKRDAQKAKQEVVESKHERKHPCSNRSQTSNKLPPARQIFGWRPYWEIPNFVNAADVCVVPRHETPFSDYYNEEGVHKISEYMFFRKPIVACGIAPSKEYLLVEPQDMAEGILQALEGKVPQPTPKTWEDDCKEKVLEVVDFAKKL